jgi:hypothetical protein
VQGVTFACARVMSRAAPIVLTDDAGGHLALQSRGEHEMPTPNPVEPHGPDPVLPQSPEQPVVPPDDPNRPRVDREPNIDPPPTDPPLKAPSERPVIDEPPAPRA